MAAKTTDTLIFYLTPGNADNGNGGKRICTALQMGHGGAGTGPTQLLNLIVFPHPDGWGTPQTMPGTPHATSLQDALTGDKWSTIPEALQWGVDLDDPDQDIEALVN